LPEREKEGSARAASRAGVGWLLCRKEDAQARGRGEAVKGKCALGPFLSILVI
jgi:hypothetical protein